MKFSFHCSQRNRRYRQNFSLAFIGNIEDRMRVCNSPDIRLKSPLPHFVYVFNFQDKKLAKVLYCADSEETAFGRDVISIKRVEKILDAVGNGAAPDQL